MAEIELNCGLLLWWFLFYVSFCLLLGNTIFKIFLPSESRSFWPLAGFAFSVGVVGSVRLYSLLCACWYYLRTSCASVDYNFSALSICKVCILRAGYPCCCLSTELLLSTIFSFVRVLILFADVSCCLAQVQCSYIARYLSKRNIIIIDVLFLLALIMVGLFVIVFTSIGTTIFFFLRNPVRQKIWFGNDNFSALSRWKWCVHMLHPSYHCSCN